MRGAIAVVAAGFWSTKIKTVISTTTITTSVSGRGLHLAGHIFANYTCPGQPMEHVVNTYTGTRTS